MWRDVVASVFPMVCPGCGGRGDPLCDVCVRKVTAAPGAPPPPGLDAWCAPYAYEGVVREVVARVKYRGAHAGAAWLARGMAAAARAGDHLPVDVVTWAPTTAGRRRARGFDHAELLARSLARPLGLPVRSLLRREPGPPQTGLAAAERRRGPRFTPRVTAPARVLLVDDVATTGATLAAAAGALRAAGAGRVVGVTAARTPSPGRARVAASHDGHPVDTGGRHP